MIEIFNKVEVFDKIKIFNKVEIFNKIEIFNKVLNVNEKVIETINDFDFLKTLIKALIKALICSIYFIKTQIRLCILTSSNSLL